MILLSDVLRQHSLVVMQSGGADGLRDKDILESALGRAFQTFDSVDLYPSLLEKAAALLESIVVNHPFVDGNKRTGYTVARTFLRINGVDIVATENEKYDFVIAVASCEIRYEAILDWLIEHSRTI